MNHSYPSHRRGRNPLGVKRRVSVDGSPCPAVSAENTEEKPQFGNRKWYWGSSVALIHRISDFGASVYARLFLKSELRSTPSLREGIRKSDWGKKIKESRNRNCNNVISAIGYRFSENRNQNSDISIQNRENRIQKSGMRNQVSVFGKRLSEIRTLLSVFFYRFSCLGNMKADIRFTKSFFAEILHLSDFSFTTSGIRLRIRYFCDPISEIRYHPRRGI